eukprot:EG_transcript_3016
MDPPKDDPPIRTAGNVRPVIRLSQQLGRAPKLLVPAPLNRPKSAPNLMKAVEKPEVIIRMKPGEESASPRRSLHLEGAVLSPLRIPSADQRDHGTFSCNSPKLPALPTSISLPVSHSPKGLQSLSPRFPEALGSDSPAFIGAVKADILCLQRKLDQLLGRKDGQMLMTRQIAKYTGSSDLQADAQVKLRLVEIRDGQMAELEAALLQRYEPLAPGGGGGGPDPFGPKETSLPTLSRLPSFLGVLQLLVGLADFRLKAGDKDGLLQALEEQLQEVRDRAGALEMQKDAVAVLHKTVAAERDQLEAKLRALAGEREALVEEAKRLRQSVAQVHGDMASLEDRMEALKRQNEDLKEENAITKEALESMREEMKYLTMEGSNRPCDRCAMVHVQWSSLQQDHAALKYAHHKLTQSKEKLEGAYAERMAQLEVERQRNKALATQYSAVSKQHKALLANADSQTRAALQLRAHYMDFVRGHLLQAEAGQRMALWSQEAEEFDAIMKDALRYRAEVAEAQVLCLSLNVTHLPSIAELDELLEDESMPQPVRCMSGASLLRSISAISLRAASLRRAPSSRPTGPLKNAFAERGPHISVDGPSPRLRTNLQIGAASAGGTPPEAGSPKSGDTGPGSPPIGSPPPSPPTMPLKTRLQAAVKELNSLQRPPSTGLRVKTASSGADDIEPSTGHDITSPSPKRVLELTRNSRSHSPSPIKAFGGTLLDSLAGLTHQPARVATFT